MTERGTIEAPQPESFDERSIARKYGLRELVHPDRDQLKLLARFLTEVSESGRCGPVPKMAVMAMLEFLQGTLNRQHITKGPRMTPEEFDVLQAPYYAAARIVTRLARERRDAEAKGKLYQTTYLSLNQFVEVLRNLVDPGCYWIRKNVPEGIREVMDALADFATLYADQREKARR
jgi:hypothetical protein